MRRGRFWGTVLVLWVAAALRLSGVMWDDGIAAHPDERHLLGVVEEMAASSCLNPLRIDPTFSYGHLPLYLLLAVSGENRLMAARLLTALLDVGTVAFAMALGWEISRGKPQAGKRWGGIVPGLFLALMPLHVQQSHFATADVPLAFFATGALLFAARAARGRARDGLLAGIWAGLAMGCKAGAVLLLLPLFVSGVLGLPGRRRWMRSLAMAVFAVVTFAVTNPFALWEFPRFLRNVAAEGAMARGATILPYTLQYRGTPPYLYPIFQQLIWGMGPVLGLMGFGGLLGSLRRAARGKIPLAEWVALAWALPYFAFFGGLYAKFPRYLLPLTPLLAVYAAQVAAVRPHLRSGLKNTAREVAMFVFSHEAKRSGVPVGQDGTPLRSVPYYERLFRQSLSAVLAGLAALPAGALSLALVLSYRQPHPWVAASTWIRTNLPPGAVIAVEEWDHPLPVNAEGYILRTLPVFAADGLEKQRAMATILEEADAVVIASRRGYGALARWSDRFPDMLAYYRALFAGELGFQAVGCWERWPHLAGLALADDPFGAVGLPVPHPDCSPGLRLRFPLLDESFVVYDHPEVVILRPRP